MKMVHKAINGYVPSLHPPKYGLKQPTGGRAVGPGVMRTPDIGMLKNVRNTCECGILDDDGIFHEPLLHVQLGEQRVSGPCQVLLVRDGGGRLPRPLLGRG